MRALEALKMREAKGLARSHRGEENKGDQVHVAKLLNKHRRHCLEDEFSQTEVVACMALHHPSGHDAGPPRGCSP